MSCKPALRPLIAGIATLALTACGGGSGDRNNSTPTDNLGNSNGSGFITVGQLRFTLPPSQISEAAGTVTLTVSRTGGRAGALSASVMANGGTATNGADYAFVGATTVDFADGDTADKSLLLAVFNDTVDEPDESFNLTVNAGSGANVNIVTLTLTITDDDAGPAPASVPAGIAPSSSDQNMDQLRASPLRGARALASPGTLTGTSALAMNYLKPSETSADAMLGSSIAVATANGKIIAAVGAPAENGNVGGVYVFTAPASGDAPPSAIRITPPIAQAMRFGYAVQLSRDGNTLAVGAPDESNNQSGVDNYPDMPNSDAPNSGAVFLYSRTNGAWSQSPVYVKAIDVDAQDGFGSAIALSPAGDVLVVGAPGQDGPSSQIDDVTNAAVDSGAAYVGVLKQGAWSLLNGILKAPRVGSGDRFGSAVAVAPRGLSIAVGAPYEDGIASSGDIKPNSGAAYLFTPSNLKSSPDLLIEQTLHFKAANGSAENLFGKSVALGMEGKVLTVSARLGTAVALSVEGNTVLVGAGKESDQVIE